jgi:broad specificity phosphatase PhoE
MKILTTEERIAQEKYGKERNEWRNATPDTCQHNWESDEEYSKRLKQSFEDYKKKKQGVK